VKGNADLDPEDGYGTGLTWRWHSGKFETEASYTLHELNSYIEKIETEPDQYTFRNVQDVRIQDAAIRFLWGSAFSAGLSWARGRDQDSGDVIDDIPPLKASLSLSPSFSAFSPYLHLLGVARQEDYGPSEVEVPGYLVINAGIEYAWNSTVTIGIHAFNLLDKEYMPSADEQAVAAPGRSIVMSIKTNFFSEE